jgi:DNA-binding transcriptional MerR regulator
MTTDLLTTRQVARRHNVDVSTISRWVSRGWLAPALRLENGQMLFDVDTVEEFEPPEQQRWRVPR